MDSRFFQPSTLGIKGLAFYIMGNYRGAADAYRTHLMEAYTTERTASDPGWNALLKGNLQEAEEISQKKLERDPDAFVPLLNLGEIALEKGAPDQAIEFFKRILEKEPGHFDALLLSSVAHTRLGAPQTAIDFLKRALRTNRAESRITSFLWALGTAGDLADQAKFPCLLAHYYRYLRIHDPSNARLALAAAKEAIASGDQPDDAYLTIGIIYDKKNKREKALSFMLKAIEVNPQNAEANRWAGVLYYERGDLLNEYRMMKAAFEASPEDPFYIDGLDHVLVEQLGDFYEARNLLSKALEINPNNGKALDRLGSLYGSLGEYRESISYYRRAALLEPKNTAIVEGIGFAFDRLGETDKAIAAFQEAVSIAPGRAEPHARLASIYYDERRYFDAISEYETALNLGDRKIDNRASLCMAYHLVSKFQTAVDCFEKVLKIDPHNTLAQRILPEIRYNLSIEQQKN